MEATIAVHLRLKTPTLPNFLHLDGVGHQSLDHAIAANGQGLTVDVARLDDAGVEAFIAQWAAAFRAHVKARKGSVA